MTCPICGKLVWESESIGVANVSGYCLTPHTKEEFKRACDAVPKKMLDKRGKI